MKNTIPLLLILFFGLSYSQNSNKKEMLYDENWNLIKMEEFKEKIKDKKYAYRFVENDTAYLGKILLKEKTGEITDNERTSLVNYLRSITKIEVDSTKNIVINFFFKPEVKPNGSCIDHYTSDYKYKKYFKKSGKDTQFFITEKGYNYKSKNVFEDKDNFIRELFFKYHFTCGNYIIIKNNGKYLRRFGEYRQHEIIEKINSEWEKM
ncbi:hypothetical protein [Lacinutrix chionoecetis]